MSQSETVPPLTVGMDLGDRKTVLCAVNGAGRITDEQTVATTPKAVRGYFDRLPRTRVILEAGTHSPWISRLLESSGHQVIVANPAALRRRSHLKTDRVDAEALARWGRLDPSVLAPIRHRGIEAQSDLELLKARDALVRSRTQLVNHTRGAVKSFGTRIPACSAASFPRTAADHLPPSLADSLRPLLEMIRTLTEQIRSYDREIEALGHERYPETLLLRKIAGVGPITALCYVLVIDDPARFVDSRSVGAFLGLVPKKDHSGGYEPELSISKAGHVFCRSLLVQSAQYILGPFGPDTDLRRWGLSLAGRGGKNAKKRAVIAVARKLAVLLHHLWITGSEYAPLYHADQRAA